MVIEINALTIITAVAVLTAIITLVKYFSKTVRFIDKQKLQDALIEAINKELAVIDHGLLSCLKGVAELGADGPVHEGINELEKHLNLKAHDNGGTIE